MPKGKELKVAPTRRVGFEPSENDIKRAVKDFLKLKHIFCFYLLQGLGAYPGLPDMVAHIKGRVVYIEVKTKRGKLSLAQGFFQAECEEDGVDYWVVRDVMDIEGRLCLEGLC